MCSNYSEPYFSVYKLNIPVIYPDIPPLPGQRIIGYMIYQKPQKCFTTPNLRHYSCIGWLTSFALSCVFLPLKYCNLHFFL